MVMGWIGGLVILNTREAIFFNQNAKMSQNPIRKKVRHLIKAQKVNYGNFFIRSLEL